MHRDIPEEKRDRLLDLLRELGSAAVAFSGGLDSSVLAKAAFSVLGDRAVALTATSPSTPRGELNAAVRLAQTIGLRHEVIETDELSDPEYRANTSERCYFCKQIICRHLLRRVEQLGLAVLLDGANADDRRDHRPGSRAARELGVQSPLAECEFTKDELRRLAQAWQLPNWNKPSSPCLSSRVAYGVPITEAQLDQIDRAERFLHEHDFAVVRVRLHDGGLARVEVPADDLPRLLESTLRQRLTEHLHACGFAYVTVDLDGFRSGSMNRSITPKDA